MIFPTARQRCGVRPDSGARHDPTARPDTARQSRLNSGTQKRDAQFLSTPPFRGAGLMRFEHFRATGHYVPNLVGNDLFGFCRVLREVLDSAQRGNRDIREFV